MEDLSLEATRGFRQSWKYKVKELTDEFQAGNLLGETEYTSYLTWKLIQQYIMLKHIICSILLQCNIMTLGNNQISLNVCSLIMS